MWQPKMASMIVRAKKTFTSALCSEVLLSLQRVSMQPQPKRNSVFLKNPINLFLKPVHYMKSIQSCFAPDSLPKCNNYIKKTSLIKKRKKLHQAKLDFHNSIGKFQCNGFAQDLHATRMEKWDLLNGMAHLRVRCGVMQLGVPHMYFVSFHYGKATAWYKTDLFQLGHHHSGEYSKMDFPPS